MGSPSARVMLMRLALYGTLLVLAIGALAARVPTRASGLSVETTIVHGTTDQGRDAHVVVGDGAIIRILLSFTVSCDRPGPESSAYGTYGGFEGDVVEYVGNDFRVGGRHDEHRRDGVTVSYESDVSGTLDGIVATGRARMETTWIVDGREVNRCRSGEVGWQVGRRAGPSIES